MENKLIQEGLRILQESDYETLRKRKTLKKGHQLVIEGQPLNLIQKLPGNTPDTKNKHEVFTIKNNPRQVAIFWMESRHSGYGTR